MATIKELDEAIKRCEANIQEAIRNRDTAERSYWILATAALREQRRESER